jgi:hypothetical protein
VSAPWRSSLVMPRRLVRERFGALGVCLNVTPENFGPDGARRQLHAVGGAGSRVIFFTGGPDGRQIVKRSEVALGDLRSPLGTGHDTALRRRSCELDARPESSTGREACRPGSARG